MAHKTFGSVVILLMEFLRSATRRTLRYLSQVYNIHIQLLIWAPISLFWWTLWHYREGSPVSFESCEYQMPGKMQSTYSACWNKHKIESPSSYFALIFYSSSVCMLLFSLFACRNNLTRAKSVTLGLLVVITALQRCLVSFSGFTTQHYWSSLLGIANPLFKPALLVLLVELPLWHKTYFAFYNDYYLNESARTVHDQAGFVVHTFKSERTGHPNEDTPYHIREYYPYLPMFIFWQDIAVRLSCITLLDGVQHVFCLRYMSVDAPYTDYFNNSEILTTLLFMTLVVYAYTRARTHVHFVNDKLDIAEMGAECFFDDRSCRAPMAVLSAKHGLFVANPATIDYRAPPPSRLSGMVVAPLSALILLQAWPWCGPYLFIGIYTLMVLSFAAHEDVDQRTAIDAADK